MTEADMKDIWEMPDQDDDKYAKAGIRIAEQLNFWINDDCTSQVTNTAVTPMLEQISEEIYIKLKAAAKINVVTNPWDFIASNVVRISIEVLRDYNIIFLKIMKILNRNKSIEITTVKL